MKQSLLLASILAASAAAAVPASAQRLTPTIIAVVDAGRVSRECTACRAAQAQLQSQLTAAQTRATQLRTGLQPDGTAIQTAVNALAGKQPDAALTARIRAFQARENTANQELTTRQQTLRSTEANVNRQITERLVPIINTVMTARGATLVVDRSATLASAPSIDVTADVLAALNQQLPSVSVTPLPAAAAATPARPPQGR